MPELNLNEVYTGIIGNFLSANLTAEEQKRNFIEVLRRNITLNAPSEFPGVINFIRAAFEKDGLFPSLQLLLHNFPEYKGIILKVKDYLPLTFKEYNELLKQYEYEFSKKHFQAVLGQASLICTENVDKAVQHLLSNISISEKKVMSVDAFNFKEYYKEISASNLGPMFFMRVLDEYVKVPLGTMMTIFAFVGHLKTTLALNFAYNSAIKLNYNVAFFSLEMSKEAILYRFILRHSLDSKFNGIRIPVTYTDIYRRALTTDQLEFLDEVRKDFNTSECGKIFVVDTSDFDVLSQTEIENRLLYLDLISPDGLDVWFLDYIQLVSNLADSDMKESERRVISNWARWAQNLSKRFRSSRKVGRGISTILLAQAGRVGYTNAKERGGSYSLTEISDSSELEKASDYVVSVYFGAEEKQQRLAKIQLLKNRDGSTHMETQPVRVDMDHIYIGDAQDDKLSSAEIDNILMGRS